MSMPPAIGPPQRPEGATSILVFGVLGLICCPIFAIVAWIQGNGYLAKAKAMGVEPEGTASVGRIFGIIGVALAVIVLILAVIASVLGIGLRLGIQAPPPQP